MPEIPTHKLLRRHVAPFALTFGVSTGLLLAIYAARHLPELSARGASAGTLAEALLLAIPFTVALTIPMAVFVAVSWVFMRLGRDRVLAAARRERHGVLRLVAPVVGTAAVLGALTFVSNTEVVPRANARLAAVLSDGPVRQSDRTMTLGELREAAQSAHIDARPEAAARAVAYEVEIQKKFALAAACLVLALAGATIPLRFPRGGIALVAVASSVVFGGYYLSLVAGETLADQQVMAPLAAMWMANALLVAVALALAWKPGSPRTAATAG